MACGTRASFSNSIGSSAQFYFEDKGVSSSGLVRNDFFDWISEAEDLSDRGDWDSVVVMLGANDGQPFFRNGVEIALFSDEWYSLYEERMRRLIGIFTERGSDLYWLSVPPMSKPDYNSRMIRLNSLIQTVCEDEGVEFIDLSTIIGDASGNYSDLKIVNGNWQQVRTDGIHYSNAGSALVTDEIINIIKNQNQFR